MSQCLSQESMHESLLVSQLKWLGDVLKEISAHAKSHKKHRLNVSENTKLNSKQDRSLLVPKEAKTELKSQINNSPLPLNKAPLNSPYQTIENPTNKLMTPAKHSVKVLKVIRISKDGRRKDQTSSWREGLLRDSQPIPTDAKDSKRGNQKLTLDVFKRISNCPNTHLIQKQTGQQGTPAVKKAFKKSQNYLHPSVHAVAPKHSPGLLTDNCSRSPSLTAKSTARTFRPAASLKPKDKPILVSTGTTKHNNTVHTPYKTNSINKGIRHSQSRFKLLKTHQDQSPHRPAMLNNASRSHLNPAKLSPESRLIEFKNYIDRKIEEAERKAKYAPQQDFNDSDRVCKAGGQNACSIFNYTQNKHEDTKEDKQLKEAVVSAIQLIQIPERNQKSRQQEKCIKVQNRSSCHSEDVSTMGIGKSIYLPSFQQKVSQQQEFTNTQLINHTNLSPKNKKMYFQTPSFEIKRPLNAQTKQYDFSDVQVENKKDEQVQRLPLEQSSPIVSIERQNGFDGVKTTEFEKHNRSVVKTTSQFPHTERSLLSSSTVGHQIPQRRLNRSVIAKTSMELQRCVGPTKSVSKVPEIIFSQGKASQQQFVSIRMEQDQKQANIKEHSSKEGIIFKQIHTVKQFTLKQKDQKTVKVEIKKPHQSQTRNNCNELNQPSIRQYGNNYSTKQTTMNTKKYLKAKYASNYSLQNIVPHSYQLNSDAYVEMDSSNMILNNEASPNKKQLDIESQTILINQKLIESSKETHNSFKQANQNIISQKKSQISRTQNKVSINCSSINNKPKQSVTVDSGQKQVSILGPEAELYTTFYPILQQLYEVATNYYQWQPLHANLQPFKSIFENIVIEMNQSKQGPMTPNRRANPSNNCCSDIAIVKVPRIKLMRDAYKKIQQLITAHSGSWVDVKNMLQQGMSHYKDSKADSLCSKRHPLGHQDINQTRNHQSYDISLLNMSPHRSPTTPISTTRTSYDQSYRSTPKSVVVDRYQLSKEEWKDGNSYNVRNNNTPLKDQNTAFTHNETDQDCYNQRYEESYFRRKRELRDNHSLSYYDRNSTINNIHNITHTTTYNQNISHYSYNHPRIM